MVDSLDQSAGEQPGTDDQAIDQVAVDALFSAGGGEEQSTSVAPLAQQGDLSSAVQEINQADIDALLSAAGAAADADGPLVETAALVDGDALQDPPSAPRPDTRRDSPGRPFAETAAARPAAIAEEPAAAATSATPPVLPATPFVLPDLNVPSSFDIDPKRVTMLSDVNLRVRIELGRTRMLVEDVLKLGEGSVVELDKPAGDPVDVYVNDRLVARGEVLVLADNFCVRISEVISNDPHRVSA